MSNEELDTAIRAAFAARRQDAGDHPTVETLIRYHHDTLPTADEATLQTHLAGCRDCVTLLLELERFPEQRFPDTDEPHAANTEATEEAVDAILERVRQEVSPTVAPTTSPPPSRTYLPLAAALLLAMLGLTFFMLQMRQGSTAEMADLHKRISELETQLATLSQPRTDLPIVDLFPAGFNREASPEATRVAIPAAIDAVALVLTPSRPVAATPLQLRLLDAAGQERWAATATPNEAGSLTLLLPRGTLTSGRYELQLRVVAQAEPLDRFPIELFLHTTP